VHSAPREFRGLQCIGLATLLAVVALSFTPLADFLSRSISTPTRLEPADAIVVLGAGGVRPDGTLSDSSLRRTLRGIDLYRRGLAKILVFTGPRNMTGHAEGEVRAAFAMQLGVPATALVVDTKALTTREEARQTALLLRSRGVARILLVGDVEGMRRATAVFERVGFSVLPAPATDISTFEGAPGARLLLTRQILMELLALAYYRAAGYL
jgi:uncharacterized SAM-binding protein YcdF (DUF218 family)